MLRKSLNINEKAEGVKILLPVELKHFLVSYNIIDHVANFLLSALYMVKIIIQSQSVAIFWVLDRFSSSFIVYTRSEAAREPLR